MNPIAENIEHSESERSEVKCDDFEDDDDEDLGRSNE